LSFPRKKREALVRGKKRKANKEKVLGLEKKSDKRQKRGQRGVPIFFEYKQHGNKG